MWTIADGEEEVFNGCVLGFFPLVPRSSRYNPASCRRVGEGMSWGMRCCLQPSKSSGRTCETGLTNS